jgi:hypothetical protein
MNSYMISQLQVEQTEIEATQEYIIDQLCNDLDERLALLRSRLNAIHQHDKQFARLMSRANKFNALCPACQQSKLQNGGK